MLPDVPISISGPSAAAARHSPLGRTKWLSWFGLGRTRRHAGSAHTQTHPNFLLRFQLPRPNPTGFEGSTPNLTGFLDILGGAFGLFFNEEDVGRCKPVAVHDQSRFLVPKEGHSQVALPLTSPRAARRPPHASACLRPSLCSDSRRARGAGLEDVERGGSGRGAGTRGGGGSAPGPAESAQGWEGRSWGRWERGRGRVGGRGEEGARGGAAGAGGGVAGRGEQPGRRPAGDQAACPRAPAAPRQLQGARSSDRRSRGRSGAGAGVRARPMLASAEPG